MKIVLRALARILPKPFVVFSTWRILSMKYGHLKSVSQKAAVDAYGQPIPWYTYPAIEYLNGLNFQDIDVFEYGAGNSSLFWSKRARTVVSVESDAEWYERIRGRSPENHLLLLEEDETRYVEAISHHGRKFNIVVVDGKWRIRCILEALKHLESPGLILLDNSDRHPDACEILWKAGFLEIDFHGFGPINGYCWTTSLFFPTNLVLPRKGFANRPIGGLFGQTLSECDAKRG